MTAIVENLPPLLILAGPTASGKSETGVILAERLNTHVISADSVQVYRHFDIGSAKPPKELLQRVPHHLMDAVEPEEDYTVSRYKTDAGAIAAKLWSAKRLPLVVGGTGLYLKALTEGLHCGAKTSHEAELKMDEVEATDGLTTLFRLASEADPEWMQKIHPNDRFRVRRALGVYWTVGRKLSDIYRENPNRPEWDTLMVALDVPRHILNLRIDTRVEAMMATGWREEVRRLLGRGYNMDIKPMRSLGYRTICEELAGLIEPGETERIIKQQTRAYAKRQVTWFNGIRGAVKISVGENQGAEDVAKAILTKDEVVRFLHSHGVSVG
ncbi:MAG: tRNA (adenosine(37)-N6)-dimethylallyltransferase MiaA [Nitrospinae bacterium]|nr:tRNA (adenosine(37)-N6)-dimethylallyltransferase MiaA [Nitrospinota bacterium]